MEELMMNDSLSLAPHWILYWYGDQSLLCDENDEFAYIEIDETEFDVLNAVNTMHKLEDIWNRLKVQYDMSDSDEGLAVLKNYLNQLIDKHILCKGTISKPIYGEKGKLYPLYVKEQKSLLSLCAISRAVELREPIRLM